MNPAQTIFPDRPINRRQNIEAIQPYGRVGAAMYDIEASWICRRYKYAHRIQNEIVINVLKKAVAAKPVVIDLGCGTGNDGLYILTKMHRSIYCGIDYSKHMLRRAADKLCQQQLRNRSLLIQQDFRLMRPRDVCKSLTNVVLAPDICAVISALALHHYELDEKRRAYTLAYNLLPKGGLFVLVDLFSHSIQLCKELALREEIQDMHRALKHMAHPRIQHTTLSERHYTEDNRPHILSDEITLLRTIGFKKLDHVYRRGQLSVIAAQR